MQTVRALILVTLLWGQLLASAVNIKVPLSDDLLAGSRMVLHIDGLKLPPHSSGMVRVFAGLPDADAKTSLENEHYLGYVAVLPKNSIEANQGIQRASVTLDLTNKRQFFAGKKQVTLTLISLGEQKGESSMQRPTFTSVYITH